MLPRFWSYGKYSSDNYGVNTLAFETHNMVLYYSYKTIVAFKKAGQLTVCENAWGVTTGKHLNWIDGGRKKDRLPISEFGERLDVALGADHE